MSPRRVRVGRALDNDLVLSDLQVSRHHALIERGSAGWELRDLGRNPTLVNGVPVSGRVRLVTGDRLTFGGTGILVSGDDFIPAGTTRAGLVVMGAPGGDLELRIGELLVVAGVGTPALVRLLAEQWGLAPAGHQLLVSPSAVVVDEPEPDRAFMTSLRLLADNGRAVVLVTRKIKDLDMCDKVLLLAGGIAAFSGTPLELRGRYGTEAAVFAAILGRDQDGPAHLSP